MKTSKLLITSLLAAAAMSAVPAYAELLGNVDYTGGTDIAAGTTVGSYTTSEAITTGTTTSATNFVSSVPVGGNFWPGAYTMMFWIDFGSSTISSDSVIFEYGGTGNTSDNLGSNSLVISSAGELIFGRGKYTNNTSYAFENAEKVTTSSLGLTSGVHHIAVTNAGISGATNTLKIYVDGVEQTLYASDGTPDSNVNLNMNGSTSTFVSSTQVLATDIGLNYGDAMLYSGALSQQSIAKLATHNIYDLTWNGGETGNWNTTDANWTKAGAEGSVAFEDYDNVTFGTSGNVAVTVADGGVTAGTVNITAGTVSFTGGTITALNGVSVTGTSAENIATLKLAAADDFASGTVITVNEGGKFELTGKAENLGYNGISVVLNGGTLSNAVAVAENKRQLYGLTLTADSTVEVGGRFGLVGANYAAVALDLGGHTLTKTGNAAFVLVNTTVKNGTLSVTEGSVTDSDNGANRGISLTQGAAITVSGAGSVNLKITSMEEGTSLTLAGTDANNKSTITLSEQKSISGNLTIGNATVNASGSGDIFNYDVGQSQTITLDAGGELALGTQRQTVCSNVDFVLNGGKISGTGADNLGHALDFFKDNTVTATADSEISANMTIRRGNDNPDGTLAFDVKDGVTLTISGNILTPASELSDVNSVLVKQGSGMLVLSGANTYNQGTRIEAGTVVAGSETALGTNTVTVTGDATLNLGTSAVTVAGLSGAGEVGLAAGTESSTLTVDSATDSTFSGSIGGGYAVAISLVKQGTGTLELSGVNLLYSLVYDSENKSLTRVYQDVSVDVGTLRIVTNTQAMTYAGATRVASGAALEVSVSDSVSVSLTSVSISEGGKLIIDLSNYASATETFALDIITASALSYNGVGFEADCTSLIGSAVELKGWTQTGWTESLAYDGSKLSLTMTIPEPSMFGLLAGLGALALAGTRRRRKKA